MSVGMKAKSGGVIIATGAKISGYEIAIELEDSQGSIITDALITECKKGIVARRVKGSKIKRIRIEAPNKG